MRPETVSAAFGEPVEFLEEGIGGPEDDMAFVRERLSGFSAGLPGALRMFRPAPTAAFSRRDSHRPGYSAAASQVRAHGFAPVIRPTGGHLVVYDRNALVIDLVASHPEPRSGPVERFSQLAAALQRAFLSLDIKAEVGPVTGEYCPGNHSIHISGRKIAGVAQRLTRYGYHLGTVIMTGPACKSRAAMADAYPALGLPFDPLTVGSVADDAPHVNGTDLKSAVLAGVEALVELRYLPARPEERNIP